MAATSETITLRFYGQLAEMAGTPEEEMPLLRPITAGELTEKLREKRPVFRTLAISLARNNRNADRETTVEPGDHVDVFPPYAGG